MTNKYYEIKYKVERPGVKSRRIRIGSATETKSEFGTIVLGTIDAVPLDWDGTFMLVEAGVKEAKRLAAEVMAVEATAKPPEVEPGEPE